MKDGSAAAAGKLAIRHGGILGVCSVVNASPYDVPDYLPGCIQHLCHFANDPAPVKVYIEPETLNFILLTFNFI